MVNNNLNLELKLNDFEGPLDLLDTLIREKKMDILNLDIESLTSQYLDYIKNQINTINIELASEYLEMSAYLIALKSKKLIPSENELQNDSAFEYERDKLIERIIQYRKYKEVVSQLQTKSEIRKQMLDKQTNDAKDYEPNNLIEEALPEKINVQKISKAITDAIDKYLMTSIIQRKILVQELSVQDIEDQLWDFLKSYKNKTISFSEYLSKIDPIEITQQFIVTTFLAILDLVRYSKITITQNPKDNEILINIIKG